MKAEPAVTDMAKNILLPGGCILCDGDLAVRITAAGVASYCGRCRWISRPHMIREDGGVHVVHPAGGFA